MIIIKTNKFKNKAYIICSMLVFLVFHIFFFNFYAPTNALAFAGSSSKANEASSDPADHRTRTNDYRQMRRAQTYNAIPRIQTHAEVRNRLVKNMFKTIVKSIANLFGQPQNGATQ